MIVHLSTCHTGRPRLLSPELFTKEKTSHPVCIAYNVVFYGLVCLDSLKNGSRQGKAVGQARAWFR
jgi:hypothetical protein